MLHRSKPLARSLLPLEAFLLFALFFAPAGAHAQQYPSARIESLGGEAVTGIIPDTLTDIYLNPAYLHRCSRLTINYGQRWTEDFSMRFPYIWQRSPVRDDLNSQKETELSLYGIPLGSWRMGISAGWYLDYQDDSNPSHNVRYNSNGISENYSNDANHRDAHNYRIDLSASREISSGTVIGIRGGGFQRTYGSGYTRQRNNYDFSIDGPEYEIIFNSEHYQYNESNYHKRISSLFIQTGLLTGEGRDERSLFLQVTRNEIYSLSLIHI